MGNNRNHRGEISLIVLSALIFGASVLGIGAGTAVKNNTQTTSSQAAIRRAILTVAPRPTFSETIQIVRPKYPKTTPTITPTRRTVTATITRTPSPTPRPTLYVSPPRSPTKTPEFSKEARNEIVSVMRTKGTNDRDYVFRVRYLGSSPILQFTRDREEGVGINQYETEGNGTKYVSITATNVEQTNDEFWESAQLVQSGPGGTQYQKITKFTAISSLNQYIQRTPSISPKVPVVISPSSRTMKVTPTLTPRPTWYITPTRTPTITPKFTKEAPNQIVSVQYVEDGEDSESNYQFEVYFFGSIPTLYYKNNNQAVITSGQLVNLGTTGTAKKVTITATNAGISPHEFWESAQLIQQVPKSSFPNITRFTDIPSLNEYRQRAASISPTRRSISPIITHIPTRTPTRIIATITPRTSILSPAVSQRFAAWRIQNLISDNDTFVISYCLKSSDTISKYANLRIQINGKLTSTIPIAGNGTICKTSTINRSTFEKNKLPPGLRGNYELNVSIVGINNADLNNQSGRTITIERKYLPASEMGAAGTLGSVARSVLGILPRITSPTPKMNKRFMKNIDVTRCRYPGSAENLANNLEANSNITYDNAVAFFEDINFGGACIILFLEENKKAELHTLRNYNFENNASSIITGENIKVIAQSWGNDNEYREYVFAANSAFSKMPGSFNDSIKYVILSRVL